MTLGVRCPRAVGWWSSALVPVGELGQVELALGQQPRAPRTSTVRKAPKPPNAAAKPKAIPDVSPRVVAFMNFLLCCPDRLAAALVETR